MPELDSYLKRWVKEVDRRLAELVPDGGALTVEQAMRHSVLAGGKRLRPVLAIAAHEAVGGRPQDVLDPACALELVHTYSLIHDDLPAMDDADLRRGRPTSHVLFGEATAILAGDALLPLAFEIIAASADRFPAERVVRVVGDLARAVGVKGMVAGQNLDLESEGVRITRRELERIHRLKTGALLEASLRLGALLGGADGDRLEALTRYGSLIGLAFQVVDDLLDVEGDAQTLGKNPGDEARGKNTYPALLGVEASWSYARELVAEARSVVSGFGPAGGVLAALAEYVVERRS